MGNSMPSPARWRGSRKREGKSLESGCSLLTRSVRLPQGDHGGAGVGFRRVPVALDQRVLAQQLLHGGALHALAAPVDQPNLLKSRVASGLEVLVNHRHDVSRRKAVKVDVVFDWDVDRLVFHW